MEINEKIHVFPSKRWFMCGIRSFLQLTLVYRVVQKTDTQFYFWDNFRNSALILTILSLLQAEIYGA